MAISIAWRFIIPILRFAAITVLSANGCDENFRDGTQVKLIWLDIPLHPGDEESPTMQHYIIEVWHCESRQIVFDPLATNDTSITFTDEPGCAQPSHGKIFVQEKHGFAGPAEFRGRPVGNHHHANAIKILWQFFDLRNFS